jgi:predicted transcriptional regulator
MKSLSLKLSESLAAGLAAAARKRGRTKSAIVREALEDFLANHKAAAAGSCLELAADLVGCVEGPGDLSFNKKHLRGFGK